MTGAIIGDGDRNEVPFTIWLFLAQIAPSLQNKKTRVTRKFGFGFGQTRRSTEFSNACIVEKHTKDDL